MATVAQQSKKRSTPKPQSRYVVSPGPGHAPVGDEGAFAAEPETGPADRPTEVQPVEMPLSVLADAVDHARNEEADGYERLAAAEREVQRCADALIDLRAARYRAELALAAATSRRGAL